MKSYIYRPLPLPSPVVPPVVAVSYDSALQYTCDDNDNDDDDDTER